MAKYNKKIVAEICKYIEDGHYQKDAAMMAGISEKTFYEWIKTKSEFRKSVERALTRYKDKLLKGFHGSAAEKRDARSFLDMLARRFPDQWGERLKVEATINPAEEIKKIMERIRKEWKQEATTSGSSRGSSRTTRESHTG